MCASTCLCECMCVCLMLSQGCCVKFTQTNNLKSEKQLPWTKCVATGNVAMRSACMCVYVCICVCVGLRQRACVWSGLLHAWTNMKGRKRAREHAHTHTQTANRKSLLPQLWMYEKIQTIECTHLLSVQTQRMQLHKHT